MKVYSEKTIHFKPGKPLSRDQEYERSLLPETPYGITMTFGGINVMVMGLERNCGVMIFRNND